MCSLKVTLLDKRRRVPTEYTLTAMLPGREPLLHEFRSSVMLHRGNSRVYRGTLYGQDDYELKAVCKIARGGPSVRELKREAELYTDDNCLLTLQGHYVPRFFGYYECDTPLEDDDECYIRMGFMFLEDCGRAISLQKLGEDALRFKVVQAMLAIHHTAHLQHNDFLFNGFRHILINASDEIRIIDFDGASSHQCGHTSGIVWGAYVPSCPGFGCTELHDICQHLCVWTPIGVRFEGELHDVFRVCTYKRLMKYVKYEYPRARPEVIQYKAWNALKEYYDDYRDRFSAIGSPVQHRVPLGIPGVEEDDEETSDMDPSEGFEATRVMGHTGH